MGQLGPSGMQGDRGLSVRSFFLSVLNIPRLPYTPVTILNCVCCLGH